MSDDWEQARFLSKKKKNKGDAVVRKAIQATKTSFFAL